MDAQTATINTNTDAKTAAVDGNVTAKAAVISTEVANKAIDTQNTVIADGDVTQAQINAMTTVNGNLDTNVTAINDNTDAKHVITDALVTSEADRVIAATPPPSSVIKSIQRGQSVLSGSYWMNVAVAQVDMSKSFLTVTASNDYSNSVNAGKLTPLVSLSSSVNIYIQRTSSLGSSRIQWELIEYV